MGNEQSGPSSRSSRSGSTRRSRRPQPAAAEDHDDAVPPPYTLMDETGPSTGSRPAAPANPGSPRPPRSPAPGSGQPQNPQPSNPAPGAPASAPVPQSEPYVGGFRVEVDPRLAPGTAPSTNPFSSPAAVPAQSSNAPPAPAPAPAQATTADRAAVRRSNTREDLLEMLRKYKTVIIVDDSSSMAGRRWKDTRAALASLADAAAGYDVEGVEIHFLNSPTVGRHMKNGGSVEALFDSIDPDGITPTGEKLEILLLDYILQIEDAQDRDRAEGSGVGTALKAMKPLNLIVLTDGEPSDDPESVIITAARRLDSRHFPLSQVGIQFVQIGDDAKAAEALQELDEALAGAHGIRDMVDTTPYVPSMGDLTPHDIAKMLLGGINRRVDKRGAT